MTSEYNVRLNFDSATPVKTGLVFKSGDKGITFNFIIEELSTTGMTAKIAFYRSNGTSVEASITGSDEVYTYTTLGNEFAVPGLVVADVKFYDSNTQRVSSASFLFAVISDTLDGFGSGTDNYSDALEQALAALNAAEQAMEDYVAAYGNLTPLNPKGVYDAAETYKPSDCVSYGGTSWICMAECTGETPSVGTYWMKVIDPVVSGVTSFNGRTGAVTPTTSDYDADQVDYDNTTSGLSATNVQDAVDENAANIDQTNDNICPIYATGATNTTGSTIATGTYFYLNGVFCRAIADIAANASFTLNTNYKYTSVGDEIYNHNKTYKSILLLSDKALTNGGQFTLSDYVTNYSMLEFRDSTLQGANYFVPVQDKNSIFIQLTDTVSGQQVHKNAVFTTSDGLTYTMQRSAQVNINLSSSTFSYATESPSFTLTVYGLRHV